MTKIKSFLNLNIGIILLILTSISGSLKSQTLVVLGTLQDGGSPHMGCEKSCCQTAKSNDFVSCLGVYDDSGSIIIDATPDFEAQSRYLKRISGHNKYSIFLTHAHIGHYTGLMFLGREVASTRQVPVFAMPRMKIYLEQNGPWSQLVKLRNIELKKLYEDSVIKALDQLQITPISVPHRDEFSETVGYSLKGKNKRALYIPDIDKWSKWDQSIDSLIKIHDYVFIDGTFFADGEIPRPMSEVPHPFIEESAKRFSSLDRYHRNKVYFIHLNHSNPARNRDFQGRKIIESAGMHFTNFGDTFTL